MASETREGRILAGVDAWASFYRANPHRFAEDYLNVHLRLFQKILLYMMNICYFFCYIAARGQGKSWLLAVFCCIRCILYPGTKICIASGTRGQSINILEKIKIELLPNSPLLKNEIENLVISSTNAYVDFKNGSSIKVVTASDSARSNRANILLVDEFRMVNKDTIETVLRRFLTAPRMPGYLHNPKYAHLKERNKEVYLSSAYFKSHWSYEKVKDYKDKMLDDTTKYFVCGLPYQLSIKEGLLDNNAVADEMSEAGFNETKWSMEMECLWFGDLDGTFFDFDTVSKNRKIAYPMLPDDVSIKLTDSKKVKILPKQNGEKRILSVDLALMASTKNKNDASAIFINQLLPTKAGRYTNNLVYTESSEGAHTADQALRVRKLYEMYMCDYIVIDVKGVGFGVADSLVRDINDPDTGEVYPALSCCNNAEWAARAPHGAEKALWVINATDKFNSECAILLRDGFRAGRVRLLMSEYDGETNLAGIRGYGSLDASDKLQLQMPYINTTLLINELINLQHDETSGFVKITRKKGVRKDRYSSLSYSYWVACQLESKLKKRNGSSSEGEQVFMFRAPRVKQGRRVK